MILREGVVVVVVVVVDALKIITNNVCVLFSIDYFRAVFVLLLSCVCVRVGIMSGCVGQIFELPMDQQQHTN